MLSYRHAFHAGNHADALKHLALVDALSYLVRKETPLLYVDTHAGAGSYRLEEGYAAQNREWRAGLSRLRESSGAGSPPDGVAAYLSLVDEYAAASGRADAYPGSPSLAARLLRPRDGADLFELHPADHLELASLFAGDGRIRVHKSDGPASLKTILPPPSRRALVLIDPSYELASDYEAVEACLSVALRRFETGVYIVWYPLLERAEAKALPASLLALSSRPTLHARLALRGQSPGERGMAGSGLVVFNPPWPLRATLEAALPWLASALSPDASWSLD